LTVKKFYYVAQCLLKNIELNPLRDVIFDKFVKDIIDIHVKDDKTVEELLECIMEK
jgi:hypothetical protein